MINGVLLDLAGVIYHGETAVPGATAAVDRLRQAGLPIRFVSNTTRSTKRAVLDRLTTLGLAVASDELFTPAEAACNWLRERGRSPHLLVHPDLVSEFLDLPGASATAVVVGDAGEAFDYCALNAAFRQLVEGAFVAALEFASQTKAIVLGKPSPDFFRSALATIPCTEAEAVMVGDDAEMDVAGALIAGLGQALLVRTGKYREGDESRFEPAPTATVADVSAAVDWILRKRSET
jgi:ribonucleotide monophosphatase NagD (HAD superfamily)